MNIASVLKQRAAESSDQVAYTYLSGTGESSITYGKLHETALRISSKLLKVVTPGDRVMLIFPPGLNLISAIFGCFYSGAIAVPAYPPATGRFGRNLKRLQGILVDAQPSVALCESQMLSVVEPLYETIPQLRALHWLEIDTIAAEYPGDNQSLCLNEPGPAFLQYTSGSTADPKGVIVTHDNLMHNLEVICKAFEHSTSSRGVIWLPPYHDMGLIGGILQPLYAGFPVLLMAPAAFLQKPYTWLKAISDYRATTSGGPSSAYDLCVKRVTTEQKSTLDLSSWQVAFNGAEPVRLETINAFAKAFADCGFRREAFLSCYGLAEATLMVTGFRDRTHPVQSFNCAKAALEKSIVQVAAGEAGQDLVACGSPDPTTQVIIVDPKTRKKVPTDQIGEIWVSSPSVAVGYWGKPKLSEEVFRASLKGGKSSRRYLRTGDLGFLTGRGLHVAGRLKDLIIIRGLNYYPQDIELTVVRSHPALEEGMGAAFSVDVGGEEQLVIVHEVNRRFYKEGGFSGTAVAAVRASVARDHDLAIHAVALVKPGGLPKTTSGKIQRHACRALFLSGALETLEVEVSPPSDSIPHRWTPELLAGLPVNQRQDQVEGYLKKLLPAILHVHELPSLENSDFYQLGLDSLRIVDLQHNISKSFGVELEYSLLFELSSVTQLASEICRRYESSRFPVQYEKHSIEPGATCALSYNQRALWFLYQIAPEDPAYNIFTAARIRGPLDQEALFGAFRDLVQRHEALGVRFTEVNGETVQTLQAGPEPAIVFKDVSNWDHKAVEEEVNTAASVSFDLRNESSLKVFLFKCSEREHLMVWVTHHLVTDFWSFGILFPELETFYRARASGGHLELPPVNANYSGYVQWQARLLESSAGTRLRDFWKGRISSIPQLALPGRQEEKAAPKRLSARHEEDLKPGLTKRLRQLAVREGVTLNELLFATFEVLLHRYTGGQKMVIGIPSSGRTEAQFQNLVGYCVNPLLIEVEFESEMSFSALCHMVKQRMREAIDHQNYPLPLVFQGLGQKREGDRPAGIQVMFTFLKTERLGKAAPFLFWDGSATIDWGTLTLQPWPLPFTAAQFELTLNVLESANTIRASWHYRIDLFEAATIKRMARHWEKLLTEIVENPGRNICELDLLSAAEKKQLLVEWNDTKVEYPDNKCVVELFEEQVEKAPDATAVEFAGQRLSYQELNSRANQLAERLKQMEVGPEILVGICAERSMDLVVGLMGILKAGGAYVPLDPGYPKERLAFMLADAQVRVLITQGKWMGQLPSCEAKILFLEDSQLFEENGKSHNSQPIEIKPANLAYMIYTSGSTGTPKGAMNTHRGLRNRLAWMQQEYGLGKEDAVLQKTPISFDVSVWEFFWPLMVGARLVVARPGGHQDPEYLIKEICDKKVTTLHFVPSMLDAFLEAPGVTRCSGLKRVICSGEALSLGLEEKFFEHLGAELHNLYGPTEASIDVTNWRCDQKNSARTVPIGRAIANTQIYILDKYLGPVAAGILGELHIGGVGLGRGYWKRPELTAEKFIPDPFGSEGGGRIYRTGDFARFLPDGNVEFVGRIDEQVKVRGFRIELPEIEICLNGHERVRDSVVIAREDQPGDKRITAYVLVKGDTAPSLSDLREYVSSKLPEYMVPAAFVIMDKMPLKENGKVDRKALPAPDWGQASESPYEPPRTPAEEALARILAEVLNQKLVGINDNFFHLGGNSLLMTRVVNKIREEFNVEVPMGKFFGNPTVARLAQLIGQQQSDRKDADEIGALLDELENLSTEQVEERLKKLTTKENSVEKTA